VYKPNPNFPKQFQGQLQRKLKAGTEVYDDTLKERLSRGYQTRTGLTFYEEEGVYSSEAGGGQYPQEVTGDLKDSVGSVFLEPLKTFSGVGVESDPGMSEDDLIRLDEGGFNASGYHQDGRYFMKNTYQDPQVQKEALLAMAKAQ
jgi:hypothetical protein